MQQTSAAKYRILIVDDMPDNIRVLTGVLKDKYQLSAATIP